MDYIKIVQDSVDYIEENLKEELNVDRLAGYSFETSLESKESEREIPAFWERFEIENWEGILSFTMKGAMTLKMQ